MTIDLKALNRLLDEMDPVVQKAADTDTSSMTQKGVGDGLSGSPYGTAYDFMNADDSTYIQRRLNRLSWDEKGWLLQKQLAAGTGRGVPLGMSALNGLAQNPEIAKALDTSGGAALQRQDLDPFIVSMFVSIFPAMLAGSVVVERIFTLPGMGSLIIEAINLRDRELLLADVAMIAIVNMGALLLADILYAMADPRVSYR